MHSPEFLLFDIPRFIDVWHNDPNGADSGTVCKNAPHSNQPNWRKIMWGLKHIKHLEVNVLPYRKVKSWIFSRCDGCGHRFFWKEDRFSYMSTDKVWHDDCMSLRHFKSQSDDLIEYALADGRPADDNVRFRVESMILKPYRGEDAKPFVRQKLH